MAAYYWIGRVEEMAALERQVAPAVTEATPAAQRIRYFHLATDLRLRQTRFRIDGRTLELARAHLSAAEELRSPRHIVDAQFELAFSELFHGDLDVAEARLLESLRGAERFGDATGRLRRLAYLSLLSRLRGRAAETERYCQSLSEASAAAGLNIYLPLTDAHRAWLSRRAGDCERAEAGARDALTGWADAGIEFPFEWTARFVLLACALDEQARAMLAPEQQLLSDDLVAALERGQLEAAVRIAESRGYV
jgi:hypothetical protein